MKKSTLFLSLILSVSSVFSAFAQNEYKIDPTKEITTAPDALDGVVAIPTDVDGTSVWTLKGGNDWDLGTLPLAQWGSKAQHNFVKFQKPTGDYSACGVEGNIYTLICINENGENFSQWGNPGAINMQPTGTIMFSLGFGDKGKFGQDGDYLGLWKVDYEEGKGYVLQNVGRILLGTASYASPISANPIEEKTYVKLYSELAINETITDSKIDAVLNKLNAVPANVTLNLTEVNAAKETVLANRTQENLDALANAVDAAIASANRTSLITNAEINGADGWTTEREFGGNGPLLNGTSFEYWAGNASDRQAASFNYFQTVEIPNGKYVVSVEMYNSSNGEEGDDHAPNGNAGLYATSGEETSFVGVTTDGASFGTVYNTEVVSVKDGKLTLGVKSIGYLSARWFAADNFNLWYVGELDPKQLTAGDYFIINAESGKFLNGNNAWGTKASVTETAQLMTLAVLEDGTYTIDSHISNGGDKHFINAGDNLFVDGVASPQTITEVSNGIFSIKDVNGKFLAADAEGIVNFNAEDATSAAAQWKIVTKDELLATFDNATAENPVNANFLISDANFGRNNTYNSAWQGDKPAFGGVNYKDGEFTPAGQIAEVWGGNVKKATDYYQEIEVPNGIYTLTVQGFYRYNNTDENTNDVAQTAHADGTEVIYSKLYANSDTVSLKSLFDDEVVAAAASDETVKIPFSLTEAGNAFAKGFYVNTVKVAVKTGVLKFGVTKTEHIGTDWTVWDNFRLTYNGKLDEPVPAIDEAIAKLDLAIKAADEKLASYAAGDALFQYSEAELAPLANAIAAANEAKAAEDATEESINAAKTALNEAVEAFVPKANAPKEGQAYILTLTTAENNQLSVSADGIKIEAEGTPVYFVAQENGYAISNGTEYVNYEGSNNWTMTASAEAYGWTIALVEGGYSITGKNGLLGTNSPETAAGSPCYGDKKTSNGNYIWAIAEYVAPEPVDPNLIEIAQSQGADLDNFARTTCEAGDGYTTYVANADLQIAIKLMDVDVKNCDYVVIKFAEPVAAGWKLAFWSNQDLVDIPEGATEFKYVFAEDEKCGVVDGVLPQICMMTFFGGYTAPLEARVVGIYKHLAEKPDAIESIETEATTSVKKMMVDGKVVIVKGGKTYNVAGSLIK